MAKLEKRPINQKQIKLAKTSTVRPICAPKLCLEKEMETLTLFFAYLLQLSVPCNANETIPPCIIYNLL